ncbi:MAG: iron-containing alcohol dehydrogenase, partial [Treponema sp.]|nr:iron-containing alcohol dehydrogenase [Treponema sp.]
MNNAKDPIMSLEDCLGAADETRALRCGKGILHDIPGILSKLYPDVPVFFAADENTQAASGAEVRKIIADAGIPIAGSCIFPAEPHLHAEYAHIQKLAGEFSAFPKGLIPIAIGSGTINDLVKRAAFERSLPYLCVPTAASVDGFTAFGAAILVDGFKQTLDCTAPLAVAADTDVLVKAPPYLSSSGFGDLAGKITAGADWIIAAE